MNVFNKKGPITCDPLHFVCKYRTVNPKDF